MPIVDLVVFVIITCVIIFSLFLRFGGTKKVGDWAEKEGRKIKENLTDKEDK